MKLRKLLTAIALAAGFTATAATPVATWTDFSNPTSGDYTLTIDPSCTVNADGSVTIGANGGLSLTPTTALSQGKVVTIVADIENIVDTADSRSIFGITLGNNNVNLTKNNALDGEIHQRANDTTGYGNIGRVSTIGRAQIALAYSGSSGTDTWVESIKKASSGGLRWSSANIGTIYIGSKDGTTQVMQGLIVHSLKIYAARLTEKADICGESHPNFLYKFNGNYDALGLSALSLNGSERAENWAVSPSAKAMKIVDGSTHPYGSGWNYGSGAWAVTMSAKPVANANKKIVLWATGVSSGWFGLSSDSANNKIILGSSSNAEICSVVVPDITNYFHLYTVRCDGNGNYELIVDGDIAGKSSAEYTTAVPSGSFQIGAVQQGCPSGYARTTGSLIDDLRIYQRALSDDEVKALATSLTTPETISINIGGGRGTSEYAANNVHLVQPTDCVGLAVACGAGWNNMPYEWQGNGSSKTIDAGAVKATDGTKSVIRSSASVLVQAKNTWDGGVTRTDAFMKGYLDDGQYNNHRAYVKVSDVPYSKYDVIVYAATDEGSKKFGAVKVNGTTYTWKDGCTKAGSEAWGDSNGATTLYATNALLVQGVSGPDVEVEGTNNGGRGGIAAVQIVNRGTVSEKHVYEKTMTQSCTLSSLFEAGEPVPGMLTFVTVNVTAGEPVTLTLDDPGIVLGKLIVNSSVAFTLDSTAEVSNIGICDFSGVTAKLTLGTGCVNLAPAAIPAAGLRLEGTTPVATIPYITAGFTALLEIACPVTAVGNGGAFVGNKNIVFDEGCAIDDVKFSIGNESNTSQHFEQKGGTITLTDSANGQSNNGPMLLGHWKGADRWYRLTGGTLNALNGVIRLGWDGSCALSVGGGETAALLKTKGIRSGVERSTAGSSLTVGANGTLAIGANGVYNGANDISVTLDGGKIVAYGQATVTSASGIALTAASAVAAEAGQKLTIASAFSGDGALAIGSATETGTVVFDGAVPASMTVNGGLAIFADRTAAPTVNAGCVGYYVTVNDLGSFTVPAGVDASAVKLFTEAGTEVTVTGVEGQTLSFDPLPLYGTSCLMEYLYNHTLASTGRDTGSMQFDGEHCFPGNEYVMQVVTNTVGETKVVTTNYVGIYAASAPWRNVTFPSEVTVVMYGKIMKTDDTCQIGIGSTTAGSKYSLFLASGDVEKEEVKLCYAYSNNASKPAGVDASGEFCTMSVPHAQTTDHLYAFTLQKVGNDTVVNIYLDGEVLQPYTFKDQTVTLGGGIQLGSIHGGVGNTQDWPDAFGFKRSTSVETDATLAFLRVYDVVLNDTVMRQIAKDYPYASPSGSFSRELAGDSDWVEEGAWTKALDPNVYDQPDSGSAVTITPPAGDVDLTVNLDANAAYETLTVNQGGKVSFKAGAGAGGMVNVSGKTTISTDVALDFDAIRANGAVSIAEGKTVYLDLTSIDLKNYWVDTPVKVTGPIVLGDVSQFDVTTASDAEGRTCEFRFNDQTLQTELDITVPTADIIGTVDAQGDITWTWGEGNTLSTTPDWTKVAATLVVPDGVRWVCDVGDMNLTNIVINGSADVGTTRNLTFAGTGTVDATLTAAEIASRDPVTVFTQATGATVSLSNVVDEDGKKVPGTISGGSITVTHGTMFFIK